MQSSYILLGKCAWRYNYVVNNLTKVNCRRKASKNLCGGFIGEMSSAEHLCRASCKALLKYKPIYQTVLQLVTGLLL